MKFWTKNLLNKNYSINTNINTLKYCNIVILLRKSITKKFKNTYLETTE